MRRIVILLLVGLMLVSAAPADAQILDAIDIGEVDDTRYEQFMERGTLIGLSIFGSVAFEIDGSVENPVDVLYDAILERCENFTEASAPDVGDESRMVVGTLESEESMDADVALVVFQNDDVFGIFVGAGLTMIITELLPVIDAIIERDPETPEEWMPMLDDMPAGFTVSVDDSTPEAEDDEDFWDIC